MIPIIKRTHSSSPSHQRAAYSGFTLAEVLVVIGLIGLLLSLLMPAIQASREQARLIACRNNLRQLAFAAHSYESSHQTFPYTSTIWWDSSTFPGRRHQAISPHASMMPFLDPVLAKSIDFSDITDPSWVMPPTFFVSALHRQLASVTVPVLLCPSDGPRTGATNYRANLGISVNVLPPSSTVEAISQKGAFVNGRAVPTNEFRDGLSNTAFFSERVLGDYSPTSYDPFRDQFADGVTPILDTPGCETHCRNDATLTPAFEYSYSGGTWLLGGYLSTWYLHVFTPNSRIPDCSVGPGAADGGQGIVSSRSFHRGGVNVPTPANRHNRSP
ncbi:MAG: DUF1559 domain-containing protein [Planctomycetia bacterium]|nr:DUF1559 domain-containing protein [Planctomycetia bacterium]